MKKSLHTTAILALAGIALVARPAFSQTLPTNIDDVVLGFQATSGTGATTDYEIDLGKVTQFLSGGTYATGSGIQIVNTIGTNSSGNIANDLASIYGASWATDSGLNYGLAGSVFNGHTAVDGLAPNTLFASRAETIAGTQSTPWTRQSSSNQASTAQPMNGMLTGGHGYASGNLNSPNQTLSLNSSIAVIQATSEANSWASYMPGGFNNSVGGVAFNTFSGGIQGNLAGGTANAVVDFYELAPGSGNATLVGAFDMTSAGQLQFSTNPADFAASTVPEPSTYAGLLGLATLGFVALRRRNQANA